MYRFAICDDDSQFASLLKEALITNLNRRNRECPKVCVNLQIDVR